MKIGILKEQRKGEKRVSINPTVVNLFISKGYKCLVERDAGKSSSYKNSNYREAGAKIVDKADLFNNADIVIKINPFENDEITLFKRGQIIISQLYHKSNPKYIKKIANNIFTA